MNTQLFNFRTPPKFYDPVRLKFIGAYRIDQITRIIEMSVVAHILHNPSAPPLEVVFSVSVASLGMVRDAHHFSFVFVS
jgi:hypothetical protein